MKIYKWTSLELPYFAKYIISLPNKQIYILYNKTVLVYNHINFNILQNEYFVEISIDSEEAQTIRLEIL